MSQINTFTSHDALNEDAEGPELERGATLIPRDNRPCVQERGISRRQAYRYLEHARTITHVVPIGEASVAATFKIPRDVLTQLRSYSARSGLTLSAIVTLALQRCLTAAPRRRSRNG